MIKRNIIETICEYDQEGKLLKKTVTETNEEEDTAYGYTTTYTPHISCTSPSADTYDTATSCTN